MSGRQAPDNYDDVIRLIRFRFAAMSKSYQKVALYLTQYPNDVAVLPITAIAQKCSVHASGLVRFAQSLGYRGYKDLQLVFQRRISTASPGFEARIKAIDIELGIQESHGDLSVLRDIVGYDIASLRGLLQEIDSGDFARSTDMLVTAETIHLLGQLAASPVLELLRYIFTMLGKRVVLLDASGGLATQMAKLARPQDLLFAVSFGFGATEVVEIARETAARGVPIVAIVDSTLSPLARSASVLFAVPDFQQSFSRSLTAPMCLAQSLTMALAAQLQMDRASARISTAMRL